MIPSAAGKAAPCGPGVKRGCRNADRPECLWFTPANKTHVVAGTTSAGIGIE